MELPFDVTIRRLWRHAIFIFPQNYTYAFMIVQRTLKTLLCRTDLVTFKSFILRLCPSICTSFLDRVFGSLFHTEMHGKILNIVVGVHQFYDGQKCADDNRISCVHWPACLPASSFIAAVRYRALECEELHVVFGSAIKTETRNSTHNIL